MLNKYKTLLNNTFIFAIGTLTSRLITFFLVPLYTNILTREEYGISDFIMTCSYLIVPLISLVIQDAVLRFGLSKEEKIEQVALISFIVFIFGSIITIVFTPLLGLYSGISEWKWYLCLLVITNNASNIVYIYAKTKGQNKLYSLAGILNALILAISNILLLLVFKCGVKGYLISNILANLIPVLILFFCTKMYKDIWHGSFNKILCKKMLNYSIPLILNNLSWWVLNSSDRIMIEQILSSSDLGLYTAASKIPTLLSVITSIFSNAWTISSIQEYDNDKEERFYGNVFSCFSMIMTIGASFLMLILKPFMSIYVGEEFYESWKLVPLLLLGSVFFAYSQFFGGIYNATKKNIMATVTTFFAAIVNILINLLLLSKIGVLAASISTAVGYMFIGICRLINTRKYLHFPINYLRLIFNTLLLTIQVILVTCDFNIYIVSGVIVTLIILLNMKEIYLLLFNIVKKIKSKKQI